MFERDRVGICYNVVAPAPIKISDESREEYFTKETYLNESLNAVTS